MQLSFTPTPDREEARLRLERLLLPGSLLDASLAARIDRLARAFESFASSYPLPLWAPGLVTDNEMRGLSEALFPMDGVRPLLDRLLRRACRFEPFLSGSYLHSSATWLDLLQRLLFSLMLPHHFGGGFDRYPQQSLWLSSRLRERRDEFPGGIRVLDSACGSGEGTYQVAGVIAGAGLGGKGSEVHGSTLEQIELFAAAHMFFPHDRDREEEYRSRVEPLFSRPDAPRMEFYLDQVGSAPAREPYHLVLCNGLLGGPLMHAPDQLACAFAGLAARLAPGGVLVAADRFHAGWRLRVPVGTLTALMRQHGLTPIEMPEGVAGQKTG